MLMLGTLAWPVLLCAAPKRELELSASPGKFDKLERVVVPTGAMALVSDVAGVLVVGHAPFADKHLSVFRLDKQGHVQPGEPKLIEMPKPEGLEARWHNFPMSLAVHPKLPLLYVWQDISKGKFKPQTVTEGAGLRHLLIYDLRETEPKLLQNTAGGGRFARNCKTGHLAIDAEARRLFVPNLRSLKGSPAIGYIHLNEAGLAEVDEAAMTDANADAAAAAEQPPVVDPNTVPEIGSVGEAPPDKVQCVTSTGSITLKYLPTGLSYFPVTEGTTIVAGPLGPVTWDRLNRRGQFGGIPLEPLVGNGFNWRLSGHPKLPLIYLSQLGMEWIHAIEHADGYLTLLPQRGRLIGAKLASPPVIMPRRNQFACGGAKQVHLISFDKQGHLTGQRTDVPVAADAASTIAYSERFDRLYVGVENDQP